MHYVLENPAHAFGGGWCVPTAIVGLYLHRDGTVGSGGDGPALADEARYPTREAALSAADAYAGRNDGPTAGAYREALEAIVEAWDIASKIDDTPWHIPEMMGPPINASRELLKGNE